MSQILVNQIRRLEAEKEGLKKKLANAKAGASGNADVGKLQEEVKKERELRGVAERHRDAAEERIAVLEARVKELEGAEKKADA